MAIAFQSAITSARAVVGKAMQQIASVVTTAKKVSKLFVRFIGVFSPRVFVTMGGERAHRKNRFLRLSHYPWFGLFPLTGLPISLPRRGHASACRFFSHHKSKSACHSVFSCKSGLQFHKAKPDWLSRPIQYR